MPKGRKKPAVYNVQIVDGAENCTFSIFQLTRSEFRAVFPKEGQDLQFIERVSKAGLRCLENAWERPVKKTEIVGLHGTLFYGFKNRMKHFPRSRQEKDWDWHTLNPAQRAMYGSKYKRPTSKKLDP